MNRLTPTENELLCDAINLDQAVASLSVWSATTPSTEDKMTCVTSTIRRVTPVGPKY